MNAYDNDKFDGPVSDEELFAVADQIATEKLRPQTVSEWATFWKVFDYFERNHWFGAFEQPASVADASEKPRRLVVAEQIRVMGQETAARTLNDEDRRLLELAKGYAWDNFKPRSDEDRRTCEKIVDLFTRYRYFGYTQARRTQESKAAADLELTAVYVRTLKEHLALAG